jgi:hypothetical protein
VKRAIVLVSFVLGAAAVGAVVLIIQSAPDDDPAHPTEADRGRVSIQQASPDDAATQIQGWVATSLARPLFVPDRRIMAPLAGATGTIVGLPRLSGILITANDSRAIFTAASGKPEVVTKGGRVGRYLVQSISLGGVVLIGPDGRHVLRPTFNEAPPTGTSAPPVVPGQAPVKQATP